MRPCRQNIHVLDGYAVRYRRPGRKCDSNRVPQDRCLLDAELLRIGPCERGFEVDRGTVQEHVEDPTRAHDRRHCRPDTKLVRPQVGVCDTHRALIRIDPRGLRTSIRHDEDRALRQLRAAPALPNFGDRGEAIPLALTDEAVDPNDGNLKCKNQGSEERHSSQRLLKPYRNATNGCRSGIYNSINNLQVHYRWYVTEVPISTNEGFDYKHLYFIALHDFQVASF